MKLLFQVFGLLLLAFCMQAQTGYRSAQNALYWKNKKPYEGYWQQDVAYTIKADINEKTNIITATEKLEYWNNSPHTLNVVYFHLYQNAFTKGSYLDELHHVNDISTRFGKYHEQGLGTSISDLMVNGTAAKFEIDNTVMKVYLPQALPSGSSVTFTLNFKTYFDWGTMRSRMAAYNAWGYTHFNGVHWYPRICVYDKKKGWDTDQHLNKELYGDFGSFDVELTFASNYIVEASGVLQNKSEVLPADLYSRLQLSNFASKPWNEKPSEVLPYEKDKRKTWKYYAENVHDFAFTADPSYRISDKQITLSNGHQVNCVAVVQEPHAIKWQNASDYIEKIIRTFSEDFGVYEYPKIVAADANDGMEYPMITLDGGGDPGYRGLLVHEIGHNWFYGMIGNNETYRAALDEGFTQFLTAWGLERIDGKTMVEEKDKRAYVSKHRKVSTTIDRNIYNRYISDAARGLDKALNTHSNDFNSAIGHENGYSNVYHKTATMLYNLQYVLGDTLFQKAMQHYVQKWKICHPYFEDFRDAIIEYTKVDLNWFFDQWLETTKSINYAVTNYKRKNDSTYAITFRRNGSMQMPIDFTVHTDGAKYDFHIPNSKWFVKNTTATVLPHWYGWDKLNETYIAEIHVGEKIRSVQIDTSYRLADVDMQDNILQKKLFANRHVNKQFDYGLRQPTNRREAELYWRPDVWYSGYDGVKLGVHYERSFLNYLNKSEGSLWLNTNAVLSSKPVYAVNYTYSFETPLVKLSKNLVWNFHSRFIEDVFKTSTGLKLLVNDNNTFGAQANVLFRGNAGGGNLLDSKEWSSIWSNRIEDSAASKMTQNRFVELYWTNNQRREKSNAQTRFTLRLPFFNFMQDVSNHYNFGFLQFEHIAKKRLHKLEWSNRLFARTGWGDKTPSESLLYLSGANPEQMIENKYSRSWGIVPQQWASYQADAIGHFQMGGGLNLRGYSNYYATYTDLAGNTYMAYKGLSGLSYNTELEFDNYIKFRPKLTRNWLKADCYVFFDAGAISLGQIQLNNVTTFVPTNMGLSAPRVDAGLGATFTIKNFGKFEKAEPLSIRIDWPLFINRIPSTENNTYFSMQRWVLGVNRCF